MSQSSFKKEDIILEEPKSSGGHEEKKESIEVETPKIQSGKFESQRNDNDEAVGLISALNISENKLNTIEQKPLSSLDFLESLKANPYYPKTTTVTRSFADAAIE